VSFLVIVIGSHSRLLHAGVHKIGKHKTTRMVKYSSTMVRW